MVSRRSAFFLKVAFTVLSESIATTHTVVFPVQAPLHPRKVEPAAATASRLTVVPGRYACRQSSGQLMPAGLLVTAPPPLPTLVTLRPIPGISPTTKPSCPPP